MGNARNIADGETRFVNVAGDSMTGNLEVDGIIEIDKTGDHPALRFVEDGSNTRAYMGSGDWAINGLANDDFGISSSSTGDLVLGTGAGQERLRLNNTGPVSIPSQPAFRAWLSTEWTTTNAYVNSGWTENYDRNNNFNQGTFTAPVAGVYHFTVNWDANQSQSQLHLYHNGNYTYRIEPTGRTDDNWESHGYSVDVNMAANDNVKLYLQTGSGNNPIHMGNGHWGNFQGHLVA